MPALGEPPWSSAARAGYLARGFHSGPVSYVPAFKEPAADIAAASGSRKGGRKPMEMRPCKFRLGAVPNAAGSAYIEQGGTKVIAAVYGPRQADRDRGGVLLDWQFSPFCSRTVTKNENDRRAILYKSLLQGSLDSVVLLDRYFKMAIEVNIVVLEDDGSALVSALSVASLALADACIEMRDLMAGVCIHRFPAEPAAVKPSVKDETLLLDCDSQEERRMPAGGAVLHLGLCPSRDTVCMLHAAGPLLTEPFERMVLLAKEAAATIGREMSQCLEERAERRAKRLKAATPEPRSSDEPALAAHTSVAPLPE